MYREQKQTEEETEAEQETEGEYGQTGSHNLRLGRGYNGASVFIIVIFFIFRLAEECNCQTTAGLAAE